MKKKICVFISNRANYSSIKSVLVEIKKNKKLNLQLIVGSGAILEKYGNVSNIIKNDGFKIDSYLNIMVEGSTPETMTKSTGLSMIELSTVLKNLKPDLNIVIGDRYENFSFAVASAFLNIPIAHTMGGEISGTIDESIRHAITKFSHLHFTASKDAYTRVIKLGEDPKNVFLVGCPRIDLVKQIISLKNSINFNEIFKEGVGDKIDLNQPFLMLSQHPVTTEFVSANEQIKETLIAIKKINIPTIVFWPNPDAGSEEISKEYRKWREFGQTNKMYFIKNISTENYIRLMNKTSCLVGNSSSGIRESAFIGTPVVNIGTRQKDRTSGDNVMHALNNNSQIYTAIEKQLKKNKYKPQYIYGNGNASQKIIPIILNAKISIQKKITY